MWFRKDKKQKKERAKNAGKRWTESEESILMEALLSDISIADVSERLEREPSAVTSKYLSIEKTRNVGSWKVDETIKLIDLWNENSSLEKIGQILFRKRNSILGRLNTLPGYPRMIDKEIFLQKHPKERNSNVKFDISATRVTEIVKYARKGYELEHISEQMDLRLENVLDVMDKEGIWDEYDSIMLEKAEERFNRAPKLGAEKFSVDNLLQTREEERQKAVLYIERLVQNPEGSNIEFKETFERNTFTKDKDVKLIHSVLKNICGFLNTRGGDLIIGVDDKAREIKGLEFDYFTNDEEYIRKISTSIENNFTSKVIYNCNISLVEIETKKVCWINVSPADEPAFLMHADWNKKQENKAADEELYYTRLNDSAIPLKLRDTIGDIIKNFPDSNYVKDL